MCFIVQIEHIIVKIELILRFDMSIFVKTQEVGFLSCQSIKY